jgi:signal transduction histidine kinase
MRDVTRKKLRVTTIIYWLMLLYIAAALVWWFVSLVQQNNRIAGEQYRNLELRKNMLTEQVYQQEKSDIGTERSRHHAKYVGEGVIFSLFIIIAAFFVYRSVRRQFNLQLQQQHFMMAVTHELKTPISVVKLNLETLKKYHLEPEKIMKLLQTTLDETARLNTLTNNILVSSQLEGGGYKSEKEDLDLSALLKDCVQDFRSRFPDRQFVEIIEADTDLKGDPLLLQLLINNLLENAIKYSPKEKPVTAALHRTGQGIELQVIDEGPGVEPGEQKKIFAKFYRIGNEGTRKTQGTGLGLYLCQKIAKDHNADITVTNQTPHGSKFVVFFKE